MGIKRENIFKLYKVILSFVLLFVMFIFIDSAKAQNFNYTGSVQEFIAPSAGLYKLEVWGAQGGSATANKTTKNGGYGGYSVGYIELQRNQKVYVYVGGKGADNISNNNASGGYNGGGSITTHGGTSFYGGSGGGATHIALENRGELSSYEDYKNDILIVSGGGGGAGIHFTMTTSLSNSYAAGGSGGGFEGVDGEHAINTQVDKPGGKGGTQTNGGDGYTAGSFGVGGGFHTGGGGGYYGGGGTGYGDYLRSAAGGGSGYIGNQLLYYYDNSPKQMTCYSCNTSDIGETRTVSTNCHNSTATSDCSKEGNGYARIEFITSSADLDTGDVFRSKITSNITSIRHATSAQYDLVKDNLTSDNIVSASTSPYEVYVWQDGSTLYYYSEAVIIYMNPDSARMFGYDVATNLTYIDLSGFDTSHVTSMSYMFSGSRSLESLDLSGFDTSHVTDMSYMFFGTGVQELDVSNFDTSNVTDMKSMFKQASLLETIEFGNFNTDKVTDIQSMFNGCTKLQELDLSSFNTNLVTNTNSMFYNCQELRELDLSNFDTSHFSDVRSMFSNVFKLTTIYVGDQWSIPSNSSSANMFKNSTRLMGYMGTSYDGDHVDKGYAVVDTQETPGYLTSVSNKGETHIVTFPDGEVELLPHNSILYMETNTSSNVVPYNITLKYHDGSTSDGTFVNNISYLGNGYLVDTVHSDEPCEIRINQNRTIEYDYSDSGTGSTLPTPTRNGYIFDGWYTEETGGELVERPDSESITVLHARWAEDAAYLKEGQTVNNKMDRQASGVLRKATLAEYNAATLTDDNIISTDDSLYPVYLWSDGTDILYYTDAEKIYLNANSSRLFSNIDVTSIDFSDFDTSNVTNMSYMFYALEFMEELDLSSLNTSNVTNMSYMFHYDRALRELDLSSFDTSNVTNMSYMFNECYSIEELDLSSFDTSSLQNTSQMFRNSRNLRTVYVSDTWDLSNVTNDAGMFWNDNLIGYYGWQFYWNTGDEWNRFYNKTYARIDTEDPDNRGYFTDASHKGETHTITYSDGVVEVYPHNYRITIRNNELTKSPEKVAEVTLKYHNGVTSDTKLDVLQLYYPSGWYNSVDDQSYHYSTFRITKNLELEAVFEAGNCATDGDLPRPEKEGYTFIGWYTEEEGGEQVTEYHEAEDIVLHAHWTDPFAELLPGYELSYMISEIAAASDDFNENAKYFRKGTEEEYNLVKDELTEDNLISDKDYGEYVYAWRTEEEILYYSKAEDIFMNVDSSNAFAYQSLVTIDLSGLNSSNVINMTHMFGRNFDLVSVNFGDNFNTGNVVDMSQMFAACPSLESVDLSSLNTQNVELMYSMFSSDESLETVTFGNIDTRNLQDMGNMFSYCTSLTSVDMSNLDLRSLEYTDNMFDGCTSLIDLQLSRKPILNVTSTYGMFNNCSSLEELDLTTFSTRNLSSIDNMFTYMSNLQTIYVSDLWDASNFEESNDVFCEDTNLVGEKGTTYDPDHVGEDYAIVDDAPDHPGYLTYRQINPFIIYPDGSSIQVEYGSTFTLPSKWDKEDEVVGTAVLDHQDGISDYEYLDVVRHYYLSSWYIDDTEYYPEDNIVVLSDIYLEPDYYYYTEGVNLGTPKWDMHTFDGWYTESEGGNRVYYYNDEGDAYFYAHWTERSQARIFKPDNTYEDVDLGTEYDLGTNGYSDYLIIGGVLFDYNIPDGQDSPYQYVYNVITPNGWLVNDTHYDDDTVLTVNGDLYIDYDSNSEIIPVEIPSEAHWEDWEFLGWKNRDTGEYYTDSTYSEGDSITLIGQWDKHEVKLTIDGEVQYVHEGYEYEVPSVHMFNDSIMFYLDFNDYNNPRYEEVTLAYGIDVNYQNINGVRYDIGDTYIVNEDTVINTISDTGKRVIMTPEIEDPEQRLDDQGNPEIFKGWFLNNVDYTDLMYVNVDIHALTPEDTDMNYQSLFAEYESYDPETQAIINYKDEYRMINYTKVVDKGYEFTLEDISEENIIDFQIVDSVDQTRNRGQIVVSAIVDHYDINGNNYDPDGSTYTVNENINIEVVRVVSKSRTCGGYYCSLIDEPIPSRVSNVSNTEEYIYNGIFTDDNGEGDQIDFDSYGNSSSNINYGQNIWGYFYFLREPNIILTVDNEVSIIQKGIGTIPDARNKGIDHIANVTFDFNDGETDPIVADAHYEYIFNHFEVEGVGVYQPGVEYDYEEDTTITSVYDQITWFPKFPRMDDETFIGWFTEREGGEEVLYFETLDSDITLYAHYEDPYSKVFESVIYAVADKEKEDQSVDRIIIGAESGTTVSDFKGNMDNPEEFIKIYDQDDNLLSDDDVVATGSIIKLDINGTVFDEAIIIVRGDINGDGIVNLMDRAVLADHLLSITDIEDFYLYAADINSDNVVNLQDRAILADYLLGIIDTLNE